jgi:hypothetical protein
MMLMLLCQSFCTEQVLIQLQLRLLSWQGFAGIVKINQPSAIEKNNLPRSPKSSHPTKIEGDVWKPQIGINSWHLATYTLATFTARGLWGRRAKSSH